MGFLLPLIGGLVSGIAGGAAGAANRRPPALSPNQTTDLNALLSSLLPTATGTPRIDPTLQALSYNNIAANQTGANNAVTNALVSRGLGHSGILGGALTQVANQAQQNRNASDINLQNQAIQQKQLSIQDILGLLNVNTTPGQSAGGGFLAGMAPILAYSIQNMMNNRNPGGGTMGDTGLPGGIGSTPPFVG